MCVGVHSRNKGPWKMIRTLLQRQTTVHHLVFGYNRDQRSALVYRNSSEVQSQRRANTHTGLNILRYIHPVQSYSNDVSHAVMHAETNWILAAGKHHILTRGDQNSPPSHSCSTKSCLSCGQSSSSDQSGSWTLSAQVLHTACTTLQNPGHIGQV